MPIVDFPRRTGQIERGSAQPGRNAVCGFCRRSTALVSFKIRSNYGRNYGSRKEL